jgi:hypothetical protein
MKTVGVTTPEWGSWVDGAGAFHYRDYDDSEVVWPDSSDVARDWWADSRNKGAWQTKAHDLVSGLFAEGRSAAIDVIQSMVDLAASEDELNFVGAGPIETLMSHDGHGASFVDEVERRARQQPRFRLAVAGLWLGINVPENVRARLAVFGATTVGKPPKRAHR